MRRVYFRFFLYFLINSGFYVLSFLLYPKVQIELPFYIMMFMGALVVVNIVFFFIEQNLFMKKVITVTKAQESVAHGNFGVRLKGVPHDYHMRKLIKQFNDMADEFENLENMRKSFLSNASHELRSPLTSIQGFLMAVLDGTIEDAEKDTYLKIVLSEAKRLSEIVISMLNLSRLESGRFPLTQEMFDINVLINEVLFKFERKSKNKNISIDFHFKIDPCYVFADRPKIEQVIINLIDNAINYSPNNTSIIVFTSLHLKKVYVSVKDHGYGIEKKEQGHIFDRFYTVDKARTPTKSKGTGIGLAIVKKILTDHKQIIWVDSVKNEGSTFTFTLDIFDPEAHRIANEEEEAEE